MGKEMTKKEKEEGEWALVRFCAWWSMLWNGALAFICLAIILIPPIIFLIAAIRI